MSKIILPNTPEFTGKNCDSEDSQMFEGLVTGIPKTTCDMRKLGGLFPPAFNELRRQLFEEHHDMWEICGGMMIYNHDMLFEYLNSELEQWLFMPVMPDASIQDACTAWLRALAQRPKVWRLK